MGNQTSQSLKYGQVLENDIKLLWKKSPSECPYPGREGHCSCCVGKILYTFGGVTQEGVESNELLSFNTENENWTSIKGDGEMPCPRSAATISVVGTKMYLFGGLSRDVGWFNDIYSFDTENSTWTKLSVQGTAPEPRDKVASAVIGDCIYIFGGFGPQTPDEEEELDEEDEEEEGAHFGWFDDLFIFDTKSCSWSNPMQMNLGIPTARAAHGMCAVDKYLVIFGGRDAEARRNDLHIFDTESRKWISDLEKLIAGRQPEPRSFHSVTAVGDRVVVLGGRGIDNHHFSNVNIFDTKTREWLEPQVEGELPSARGLHTATVVGDHLLLFGGSSDFSAETMQCHTFHNDIYMVSTADVTTGKAIPKSPLENQENIPAKCNVLEQPTDGPLKPVSVNVTSGNTMDIAQ